MKASALLSAVALSSCAFAAVTIPIAKSPEAQPKLRRRDKRLLRRAAITESLQNNATGGDYIAQISVGTPAQTQTLLLDTGSSDVWLLSSTADLCTDPELQSYYGTGGCSSTFVSSKSSTYKVVDQNGFDIEYEDQSGATGDYITDTVSIGGATIKALEMGLATKSSSSIGVLGIGYDVNEASNSGESSRGRPQAGFIYPSIIDTMVSQGLIASKAYSLYLNDLEASTGSIIFGGLDSDKYHGSLLQMPVVPDEYSNGTKVYADLDVALTGFGITSQSGSTTNFTKSTYQEPVILDSGTTATYLPDQLVDQLIEAINGVDDSQNSGNIYVDCSIGSNTSMTFNFGFGGPSGVTITVPVSELVFSLDSAFSSGSSSELPDLPFNDACAFGILPGDDGPYILGDTFLRSAYVVYDLSNNLIAIAQTNFNSTTSKIVDFTASATGIPNVSGAAASATVSQTATGVIGNGGGQKTVTVTAGGQTSAAGTGTGTGSGATSTKSKSAAVGSVPAFDGRGLFVLGISAAFAVLGGGLFLM
ncbi:acid protease [Stipitochalara longipes BDJ]|nr:acid protease [Stipitochalara longipes BDJ]